MTPEQTIQRANRAKEVLENEAYLAAYDEIKEWIDAKWRDAPLRDTEGREHLWMLQHLLSKLQTSLEQAMGAGKLVARNLEHKKTMAQRLRDFEL